MQNYFNIDYVKYLGDTIIMDGFYCSGIIVPFQNVVTLTNIGLSLQTTMYKGKKYLNVHLVKLLFYGMNKEIKFVLRTLNRRRSLGKYNFLYEYYFGSKIKSYEIFNNAINNKLFNTFDTLLITYFNNNIIGASKRFKNLYSSSINVTNDFRYEEFEELDTFFDTYPIYTSIYDEYKFIGKNYKTGGSLLLVKEAFIKANYFNKKKEAQEYLILAEDRAQSTVDYILCAQGWRKLFNQKNRTLSNLLIAEKNRKNILDDYICAIQYKLLLNNEKSAKRILVRMEELSELYFDWTLTALGWEEIFGDLTKSKFYRNKAINLNLKGYEYALCALDWYVAFPEQLNRINSILKKAEFNAKYLYDWAEIAKAWKIIFNDVAKAKEVMLKFEKITEIEMDHFGMIEIAKVWISEFNDKIKAKSCLLKSENLAVSNNNCDQLINTAKAWSQVLGDQIEANRCLVKTEKLFINNEDFYFWMQLVEEFLKFNEFKKAINILLRIEKKLVDSQNLTRYAFGWLKIPDEFTEKKKSRFAGIMF